MQSSNPKFPNSFPAIIIEVIIKAAVEDGDTQPFELLDGLARPFEEQPRWAYYADRPQSHERVLKSFCGT
jgi:hypothetical protein